MVLRDRRRWAAVAVGTAALMFVPEAAPPVQRRASEGRVSLPAARRWVLEGTVQGTDGLDLKGAHVRVFEDEGSQAPLWTGESGEGGRFRVECSSVGKPFAVEASRAGYAPVRLPWGEGAALRFVLPRLSGLVVVVLGSEGRPAAGARVWLAGSGIWPPRQLQSEEGGVARFLDVPSGVYEVRAERGSWLAEPLLGVSVEGSEPVSVTVRLQRGFFLHGRVVDAESKRPVIGAEVRVTELGLSALPRQESTGSEGEFRVGPVRKAPSQLSVTHPDYTSHTVVATPADAPLRIELERSAAVIGEVVDGEGRPVVGARISLVEHVETAPAGLLGRTLPVTTGPVAPISATGSAAALDVLEAARTDGRGAFRLEGVPPGRVQLQASHPDYAIAHTATRLVSAGATVEGLRIVLSAGGSLEGRVTDARGHPISRLPVELRAEADPLGTMTVSDDAGEFVFAHVLGAVVLTAMSPDGVAVRWQGTLRSGESSRVALVLDAEFKTVRGRVLDARGYPAAAARISFRSVDPAHPAHRVGFSEDDGSFVLSSLPMVPFQARAEHPDHAPSDSVLVDAKSENVELSLQSARTVRGRVLTAHRGRPVAGAFVEALSATHAHSTVVGSDEEGAFELRGLPDGSYELLVTKDGFVHSRQALRVGERMSEIEVELAEAGSLEGTVLDRRGQPVSGARVSSVLWADSDQTVQSARDGAFRLVNLRPGGGTVEAVHPAAGRASVRVDVRGGQVTDGVELLLPRSLDERRAPELGVTHSAVCVRLALASGAVVVAEVPRDSKAYRAGLRPGDRLRKVDGAGVETLEEALRALRGPEGVDAQVEITRQRGRIRLFVPRERFVEASDWMTVRKR